MSDDDQDDSSYRIVHNIEQVDNGELERYWRILEKTLDDVFNRTDSQSLIRAYRARIQKMDDDAKLHAYHLDPLQVAADLTECGEITWQQKASYSQVLADFKLLNGKPPSDASLDYRAPEDMWAAP